MTKEVVTRKWVSAGPYTFRTMFIMDRIHFGLGIILDRHPERVVSLNFHIGPVIWKFQIIGDMKWLRKRAVQAIRDDIKYLKKIKEEYE